MTHTGQKMLCGGEKMEQKLRRDRNLGDNLRRLRNASGLSQEKLCAELQRRGCDIGRTTYAKYEAGERNVRVSVLLALKRLYGCPFDAFFAGLDTADDAEALQQDKKAPPRKRSASGVDFHVTDRISAPCARRSIFSP